MQVIVSFRILIFSGFRNKIWTPDLEFLLNLNANFKRPISPPGISKHLACNDAHPSLVEIFKPQLKRFNSVLWRRTRKGRGSHRTESATCWRHVTPFHLIRVEPLQLIVKLHGKFQRINLVNFNKNEWKWRKFELAATVATCGGHFGLIT